MSQQNTEHKQELQHLIPWNEKKHVRTTLGKHSKQQVEKWKKKPVDLKLPWKDG